MNIDDLEKPFATGRTAEIFAWQGDKVLKLFLPSIPVDWIDQETETGRYIQGAHLPVPKLYERVTVSGREGLVYERVDGPSLLTELATRPWKVTRSARLLARLHAQVHEVKAPAHLETQREWARGIIGENEKLPLKLRQAVLNVLEGLPDGEQLCHGDFHPGNILVTARGAVIIDWMTASRGTAAGDVARTAIILEAAQPPPGTPMRWLIEWIRPFALPT